MSGLRQNHQIRYAQTIISGYTLHLAIQTQAIPRHTYPPVVLYEGDLLSRVTFEGGHWSALPVNVVNPVRLVVVPVVGDATCTVGRLATLVTTLKVTQHLLLFSWSDASTCIYKNCVCCLGVLL